MTKANSLRSLTDTRKLAATRQPQTPSGFQSVKPAPRVPKRADRQGHYVFPPDMGLLVYWTKARSMDGEIEAHIAVSDSLADEAGLQILVAPRMRFGFTKSLAECWNWKLLYNRMEPLCFRIERSHLSILARAEYSAERRIRNEGRRVGYIVSSCSKVFSRIIVPIKPGMPLPLCEEKCVIRNFSVVSDGLHFSLDEVTANGGAK